MLLREGPDEKILRLGREYDGQRDGASRGLFLFQRLRDGLVNAVWTNKAHGQEPWELRAVGHDVASAKEMLIRLLLDGVKEDAGKKRRMG